MSFAFKKTGSLVLLGLIAQSYLSLEAGQSMSRRRKAATVVVTGALLLTAGQFLSEPAAHGKHHHPVPAEPGTDRNGSVLPAPADQPESAAEGPTAMASGAATTGAGDPVPDLIRARAAQALKVYRDQACPVRVTGFLEGDEVYLEPTPPGSHRPEALQARFKQDLNSTRLAGNHYHRAGRLASILDGSVCMALQRYEQNERDQVAERTRILQDELLQTSTVGYSLFVEMQYTPIIDKHLRAHLAADRSSMKTKEVVALFHDIDLMTWCRDTSRKAMKRFDETVLPLIVDLLHWNATEPAP